MEPLAVDQGSHSVHLPRARDVHGCVLATLSEDLDRLQDIPQTLGLADRPRVAQSQCCIPRMSLRTRTSHVDEVQRPVPRDDLSGIDAQHLDQLGRAVQVVVGDEVHLRMAQLAPRPPVAREVPMVRREGVASTTLDRTVSATMARSTSTAGERNIT